MNAVFVNGKGENRIDLEIGFNQEEGNDDILLLWGDKAIVIDFKTFKREFKNVKDSRKKYFDMVNNCD